MRLTRIAALAATFALSLSLAPVTPANAYAAVTIGTPDVSTPGHVKVRVSSADAPYVSLRIGDKNPIVRQVSGGYADFDLATWGFDTAVLSAGWCTDFYQWTCSTPTTQVAFTATQAPLTLTWPTDHFIGPGEGLEVTVDDPVGGGILRVVGDSFAQDLIRNDVTSLHPSEGFSGILQVYRCAGSRDPCVLLDESFQVSINRELTASVEGIYEDVIVDGTSAPDSTATLTMSDDFSDMSGPVVVNWTLWDLQTDQTLRSGTAQFQQTTGNTIRLDLDMDGLPDGRYGVGGTLSAPFEDFGTVSGQVTNNGSRTLDNTPPEVTILSAPKAVYPFPDMYRDGARFTVWAEDSSYTTFKATILNAQGVAIRTLVPQPEFYGAIYWNGKAKNGTITYGEHTVVLNVTDSFGNTTEAYRGNITVYPDRLEERTWSKKVKAKRTMGRWAGECSSFKSPSSHGWKKSLGLNSRTLCKKKSWEKSGVVAQYEQALPLPVSRYTKIRVRTYGAAGRSQPRSLAYIYLWNAAKQRWKTHAQLSSKARYYNVKTSNPEELFYGDRFLAWRVFTGGGARYDVRDFTIEGSYRVLRDPTTGAITPLRPAAHWRSRLLAGPSVTDLAAPPRVSAR